MGFLGKNAGAIAVIMAILSIGFFAGFWVNDRKNFEKEQTEINTNQIKINLIIADNAKGIANNAKGIADNAKVLKKIEKYIIELRQKKKQSVKTEAEKEDFYSKKQ